MHGLNQQNWKSKGKFLLSMQHNYKENTCTVIMLVHEHFELGIDFMQLYWVHFINKMQSIININHMSEHFLSDGVCLVVV